MLRICRTFIELIAAFVGVVVVLALLLVWRLSTAPVASDFLTPYIETGIESILPDSKVTVGVSLLTWDGAKRSVSVHTEKIHIIDAQGKDIADIPFLDAEISVVGLLFGQFMPKELAVDHPEIHLVRQKDGVVSFGGHAVSSASSAPATEDAKTALAHGVDKLSRAALMHKLAVTRAIFDVHDEATQGDWSIGVPEISLTRSGWRETDKGLEFGALDGRMAIEATQKDGVATIDIRYAYDPRTVTHALSVFFNDLTPSYLAGGHPETLGLDVASMIDVPLTGKIDATFDQRFALDILDVHMDAGAGALSYAAFWDAPCPLKSANLTLAFDRHGAQPVKAAASVDLDGPGLALTVTGVPSGQAGQDVDYTADLTVDRLPMNRYAALWPKSVLPDPRDWLVQNLRDGVFTHAEAHLKGAVAWDRPQDLSVAEGEGGVSAQKASVTYLDGMPPVENVSADATFDLKKMDVRITGGALGAIRLSPFTVQITGLADPDQYINIPLQVSGPVPEILRLLDHKPLEYAKALGIAPNDVQGVATGSVDFKFPLLKTLLMKDLGLQASIAAKDIASSKLVKGIAIDQGTFALTLDMKGFALKGPATLNKLPFQIVWQENFAPSPGEPRRKANVTGAIRDDQWKAFGIDAFAGTKGPIAVVLDITQPDKKKVLYSGALDMAQAAVQLDMLDWKKPAGTPATLKFSAVAPDNAAVSVTSLDLRGPQTKISGTAQLSKDMSQLLALHLNPMIVGRTNAALNFTQSFGVDGALQFDATGTSLDVAGLRGGKDPASNDPRPKEYRVKIDHLYTGAIGEIAQAQGMAVRDKEGWRAISLHGLADGTTPLNMDLTAQADGKRTFAIDCDDFGKAMKGLGFTDSVKGGKIAVTGQSAADNNRQINGHIKISSFTVEKLPVLALLLNALSPFGFTGILTDSADFSHFEGDFRWTGDVVALTKAHAAGSAVGINADGKIDMNSGNADLQGTVVPFSVMNKFINYIPIIGDLITGGEDQGVLAVAYKLNGPLSAPKLSVNPVSLLTPGFIRNLFFGDDSDED